MEKPNYPTATSGTSNEEDEEDTISLSGLFLYSDSNIEFRTMSNYDSDEDFEFSSDMMITSHHHDSSNPVVFCGKIIPKNQQKRRPDYNTSMVSKSTKPRWFVFMFGFGSRRYPKKTQIRDLKERQVSVKRKLCCSICYQEHHEEDLRMRSGGLIRFLGCGGGGVEIDHHDPPCKLHY